MDMSDRQSDTISRQAAIEAVCNVCSIVGDFHKCDGYPEGSTWCEEITALRTLPSAEPEISRIEQVLHGKTPEEQYEFIYWLLMKSALNYSNSRLAIIEWLRGEKEDG